MADQQQFGCSMDELKELMKHRGLGAYETIQLKYGGSLEICSRLRTSPNEGKPLKNSFR